MGIQPILPITVSVKKIKGATCQCYVYLHIDVMGSTSGSRIWSRGGPRKFLRDFADIEKQSQASKASQYWPGSRARLRALEALAFLTVKYAFSHFSGTFSSNYLMYICVDELQNIYFNMNRFWTCGKCNFPFLYLRQSRVLFFHLLLFAEALICKPGVWGPLRAPEAVTL